MIQNRLKTYIAHNDLPKYGYEFIIPGKIRVLFWNVDNKKDQRL